MKEDRSVVVSGQGGVREITASPRETQKSWNLLTLIVEGNLGGV